MPIELKGMLFSAQKFQLYSQSIKCSEILDALTSTVTVGK